ncbi:MAG: succinate dehydrogenase/fumarate reductase iron-sulfur subunit [Nitrospiria bacterium]
MRIHLSIKRYQPEWDREPELKDYYLDIRSDLTVLETLIQLKEEEEGSLAFRFSCRSAICGSCAMRINGSEKLACQTSVREEYEQFETLKVEPLSNASVIKDLVVDMGPFWGKVQEVSPWLRSEILKESLTDQAGFPKEAFNQFHNVDACIMCGACSSACNSLEVSGGFIGPAALAKAYRFIADPRETDQEKKKRLERLVEPDGIWDCVRCNYCVEVCPKDVKPMEAIIRLRRAAMKASLADSPAGRHITAFVDIVKKEGRLNEGLQPLKMLWKSPLKLLEVLPLALKMGVRGKLPFVWHWPIKGIGSIRKIFKARGF